VRFELTGAAGDDVWVRENEIGWAGEHQWVVACSNSTESGLGGGMGG
jgi:hypothetical protein